MKYCSKCGNELFDEAVMCPKCGCPTEAPQQTKEMKEDAKRKLTGVLLIAAGLTIILITVICVLSQL